MRNIYALNAASRELNKLLSVFTTNTDRDCLEIAIRDDQQGGYVLMRQSATLPGRVSHRTVTLGIRLGFCQEIDRIGKTIIMRVVAPHRATPPSPLNTAPRRGKTWAAF